MHILYIIASAAFFLWIIRNTLFWVSLWQLKEYRLDRLLAHLRETSQGRSLILSSFSLLKWVGIFVYVYFLLNNYSVVYYQLFVTYIFIFEALLVIREIFARRIKRPQFTTKALILAFLTLGAIVLFYAIPLIQEGFLWMLLLDRVVVLLVCFFVFFFSFPTRLYQDYLIDRAIKKRRSFSKLTVIGVTGSFGKSSTKEYTAQILSKKFRVEKTKGTNNTPIGVANAILKQIRKDTEIFVAEMGAYKKGEIAELCQIARPQIGVLTAVSYQHLSLFGSPEKLAQTKYELIESLPKDGLGLFNGNNENVYGLYKKTRKQKTLYVNADLLAQKKNIAKDADIIASNILAEKTGLSFNVQIGETQLKLRTSLLGIHAIENILPGIYLGYKMGMTQLQIKHAVAHLTPLDKTMVLHKAASGAALIDDTFNVNPDGVIAAMEYAMLYKGKRVLVLEPMIELGGISEKEHYRVGKFLAGHCDFLFLTKKNFYTAITNGIVDGKGKCVVKIAKPAEIVSFLNGNINKDDIVVFEGKEAAIPLRKIV